MSRQVLGPKWLRRLSRLTGHEVIHGSAGGSYVHLFTTADHRHGTIDVKTMTWTLGDPIPPGTDCPARLSSCSTLFGDPTKGRKTA